MIKSAPASLTDLWVSAIRVAGGKFATLSVQSTKTQLQRKYDIGFAIKQGGWAGRHNDSDCNCQVQSGQAIVIRRPALHPRLPSRNSHTSEQDDLAAW